MIVTAGFQKVLREASKQLWRVSQSRMIISAVLWATTLAGVFLPYVGWRFAYLGVTDLYTSFALLFLMIFAGIFFIGYIYDRVLELWREYVTIATEKNPFNTGLMTPKEVFLYTHFHIPKLEALARQLAGSSPKTERKLLMCSEALDGLVRLSLEEESISGGMGGFPPAHGTAYK